VNSLYLSASRAKLDSISTTISGFFVHKSDLLDILTLIAYNLPIDDKNENIFPAG
jgi:hypothetical protein